MNPYVEGEFGSSLAAKFRKELEAQTTMKQYQETQKEELEDVRSASTIFHAEPDVNVGAYDRQETKRDALSRFIEHKKKLREVAEKKRRENEIRAKKMKMINQQKKVFTLPLLFVPDSSPRNNPDQLRSPSDRMSYSPSNMLE